MARIKYVGLMDSRGFSAADLKSLGVEDAKKVEFARKEPTEVSDEVHKALLDAMPTEFADAGDILPLDDNSKQAAEEQAQRDLTEAQRAKAEAAGKKAAKKAKADAEAVPTVTEAQEAETGAHPQSTEGDSAPASS